jgi:hypothetical protein
LAARRPRSSPSQPYTGGAGTPERERRPALTADDERFVGEATDLGLTKPYVGRGGHKGQVSLREVLVHMIEEYARHIGHADLLRERIDGRVGL